MINPNTKCIHISSNIQCFKSKYFDWSKASNSTTSNFVPFADEEKDQMDESSPLISSNEGLEIHHVPKASSTSNSMKITTNDGALMRYQNLSKIYSSCSFALTVMDPMNFKDAKMSSE